MVVAIVAIMGVTTVQAWIGGIIVAAVGVSAVYDGRCCGCGRREVGKLVIPNKK